MSCFSSFPSRKLQPSRRASEGKMSKSCKGLAMELVKCLSETDCVKVQNRPYKECAGEKVPCITSECVGLRETYFNCKRGQANRAGVHTYKQSWSNTGIWTSPSSGGVKFKSGSTILI
nr:uncharacterized protein LOC127345668 isoform X3 [Lolium perenne]XP_051228128.1 uncharacterized protein LOC127345668 isoform X3 [Lolium perenne]